MNADFLTAPLAKPEWKRSGPFLLLAITLHGLALAWPLARMTGPAEVQTTGPLTVSLIEQPVAPPAAPQLPPPASPQRERPQKAPRPVIAMPSKSQPVPSTFVVPPAPAIPAPPAAPIADSALPATQPALTPARFNAAYLHNPEPVFPSFRAASAKKEKCCSGSRSVPKDSRLRSTSKKAAISNVSTKPARRAVGRWRFVPARRGEQPVEGAVIVPIVFRLDD